MLRPLLWPTLGTISPYILALYGSLIRVHALPVYVEGDPAVRVPQELLYRLHIFLVGLQPHPAFATTPLRHGGFVQAGTPAIDLQPLTG